jgi:hypothetical protein
LAFPSFFLLRPDHIASRILRYVKSAVAETDVPEGLPEFINQRRRWLNGSFFAATYAIAHVGQMLSSGHTVSRKVVLSIQTVYNVINLIASWFSIVSIILETMLTILSDQTKGNFYLFFVILSSSLEAPSFHMHSIRYLNSVVQVLSSHIRTVFNLMRTSTLVPLGFHCHCLLPVRHGQQTTIVSHLKVTVIFSLTLRSAQNGSTKQPQLYSRSSWSISFLPRWSARFKQQSKEGLRIK